MPFLRDFFCLFGCSLSLSLPVSQASLFTLFLKTCDLLGCLKGSSEDQLGGGLVSIALLSSLLRPFSPISAIWGQSPYPLEPRAARLPPCWSPSILKLISGPVVPAMVVVWGFQPLLVKGILSWATGPRVSQGFGVPRQRLFLDFDSMPPSHHLLLSLPC